MTRCLCKQHGPACFHTLSAELGLPSALSLLLDLFGSLHEGQKMITC